MTDKINEMIKGHVPAWVAVLLIIIIVAPGSVERVFDTYFPTEVSTDVDELVRQNRSIKSTLERIERKLTMTDDTMSFYENRLRNLEAWRRFVSHDKMRAFDNP